MKLRHLMLANLRRHALRSILTILSIAIAFLLFAYLAAIHRAFNLGVDVAGTDRLIVRNSVGIRLLPLRYEERIEEIEGVVEAMPLTFMGGKIGDQRTLFPQFAVRPDEFRTVYPELLISDEELERWMETRTGAIVGRVTAERLRIETGDSIFLGSELFPSLSGAPWEFEFVGVYEGAEKGIDETVMFFRQDYFDENRVKGVGDILMFMVIIDDPDSGPSIAEAIDAEFLNSDAETQTESEAAFLTSIAAQIGDIGAIVIAILSAVFFTILLVAGNTMMQSVRERTTELGLLKAIGFTDRRIVLLVLAESMLLAVAGGGIGLITGVVLIGRGDPTGGMLPAFYLSSRAIAVGALLIVSLGAITAVIPASEASRLTPVDALRRE